MFISWMEFDNLIFTTGWYIIHRKRKTIKFFFSDSDLLVHLLTTRKIIEVKENYSLLILYVCLSVCSLSTKPRPLFLKFSSFNFDYRSLFSLYYVYVKPLKRFEHIMTLLSKVTSLANTGLHCEPLCVYCMNSNYKKIEYNNCVTLFFK